MPDIQQINLAQKKKSRQKLPSSTHALIKDTCKVTFSRIFTLSQSMKSNQDRANAVRREFSRAFLTTAVGQWAFTSQSLSSRSSWSTPNKISQALRSEQIWLCNFLADTFKDYLFLHCVQTSSWTSKSCCWWHGRTSSWSLWWRLLPKETARVSFSSNQCRQVSAILGGQRTTSWQTG